LLTVILTGLVYILVYLFNETLLPFTRFADGVNWVYLPSGLRLTMVLVFGAPAALGIAWASALLTAWPQGPEAWSAATVTGTISGGAPWLALLLSKRVLQLKADLAGLEALDLLKMALIFAIISAALHQAWYGWSHPTSDRAVQFAVMTAGDLVGSLAVLYFSYLILRKYGTRF